VDEKYAEASNQPNAGLEQLASRLQLLIQSVRPYATADSIAVIPGTEHQYSDHLGKKLSERSHLTPVLLSLEKGTRHFAVDRKIGEGRTFILIDDVYRTGRTFRDAASCLFAAGAEEILGLAVTCTISRTDLPCRHSDLDDAGRIRAVSRRERRLKLATDYLQKVQHKGGLSPESTARAIEELHTEHAPWLLAGEG
jgi:hypothetical protein